jgi:hypothetical protein
MTILNSSMDCTECGDRMAGICTHTLREKCWTCSGAPVVEHPKPEEMTRVDRMRARAAEWRQRTFNSGRPYSGGGGSAA